MRSNMFLHTVRIALVAMALAALLSAQTYSRIDQVAPGTVKVGDSITLSGEGLAKTRVAAVFLSTDTEDFVAVVTEQAEAKIVMKTPKVKAGRYKIALQVDKTILIQPQSVIVE